MPVDQHSVDQRGVDRRDVLVGGLSALGGLAAGAAGGVGVARSGAAPAPAGAGPGAGSGSEADHATTVELAGSQRRPFHGEHQPGIMDAPQAHGVWVAMDLVPGADVTALQRLMRIWTQDVAQLMAGRAPYADFEPELTATTASLTVRSGSARGCWGCAA